MMKTKQSSLMIVLMSLGLLVIASAFAPAIAIELSDAEAAGLLYMREEEKLAHDVYTKMYEEWGLQVFANIANSETAHTEAVKRLLDTYGLEDPAEGNAEGVFTNPELQKLYDDLVARGSQSLEAALAVGGAIEEIDILDLQEELAATDKADIQRVYESLLAGSENHLRAFSRTSENQTGQPYQPHYMTREAYDQILAGGSGQGNGAGMSGGQGRGNGGGKGNGGGNGGGSGARDGSCLDI